MRFYNKVFTTFIVIFLFWEFFAVASPAFSCWSVSCVARELENRYHLNRESIQNQGEFFNVSDQKKITPEVSLFFTPSDPKDGEKISAKAFPIYFSSKEGDLYYTWYLKHKDCVLRNNVRNTRILDLCNASDPKRGTNDRENPGDITLEDWKMEATRIIAQNGYEGTQKSSDHFDDDSYAAKFGGENKTNVPDHCYIHDAESGINYELTENSSETNFVCPNGFSSVCMEVNPDDTSECDVSGIPVCSDNGSSDTVSCDLGDPRCLDDSTEGTACSDFSTLISCSTTSESSTNPVCNHLFPNAPNETSGDGEFKEKEEIFWGTDPTDPDTADNGNKDEANVTGLGRQTFTWNYAAGDMVGVVVEGTSMIQTKHDDSSFMIMWAFSKNDCEVSNKGSYNKTIKGYGVNIPTAAMDLNSCLEKNLVDPTEGGQATNLDVAVTATPENPVNDETDDKAGDTVIAQTSVSNSKKDPTETLYKWNVGFGDKISNTTGDFIDITEDLQKAGLLDNTKGNALDSIAVKMDIKEEIFQGTDAENKKDKWKKFTADGIAYLRFKVDVTENFASGMIRHGKSDVIVKFISSERKIKAYRAFANPNSYSTETEVELICDEDALDRSMCRIIRNEIIGLKVDNDDKKLSNFHWTINDTPLLCSYEFVSDDCSDEEERQQYKATGQKTEIKQGEVNFFPVTGDVGDTYTVTVTANDTTTDYIDGAGSNKGDIITLTRTFQVVDPMVTIKSLDESIVWPKLLGQYRDITGKAEMCPGGLCNDYSTIIFQAFPGSQVGFKAAFIPSFLKDISLREWRVDGEAVEETNPGEIYFTADKLAGEIYNVDLAAQVMPKEEVRRALLDIWNVSPFDSTEINFATAIQTELKEPVLAQGPFQNERKYLAALVSYVPSSVLFTFRIVLSAGLLLFVASFLNALLQDRRMKSLTN